MKKFLLILGMVTCLVGLSACGEAQVAESKLQYTEADIADAPESLLDLVSQVVATGQQEQAVARYPELADAINSWAGAAEEIGTVSGVTGRVVEMGAEEATVTLTVDGDLHDAEVVIVYGMQGEVAAFTVNVIKPLGELMTNAALNTLLGMGTVFIVLILISLLIGSFKYIAVLEKKAAGNKAKKNPAPAVTAAPAEAPAVEEAQEDDCELVAVIAAAIAASEGAQSTDGFVVRSIKRRVGGWQKA